MTWNDRYLPNKVEKRIYNYWEKQNYFSPITSTKLDVKSNEINIKNSKSIEKSFSIILPPPNITGSLHLGHALNHTIQDCLIRWKKMKGYKTTWFPGTDHAGIATQIQIEKQIAKLNKKKEDIGRKEFLKQTWEWKNKHDHIIVDQMKRLGNSCDWSKHLFTLDPSSAQAIKKAFVHFYKKDWIYRGSRLVNWSTKLSSAISDLEVEHKQIKSHLWKIKYPIENSKDFLIVATTRPETLLADQAVAVNPKDERYKKYHGKRVILPLTNKVLPIIQDSFVDPQFGTGVVKITPAHDFNDAKIGKKHNLKSINLLNKNGTLNENASIYKNLTMKEARDKIVSDLQEKQLLESIEPYTHQVAFCARSGGVIEPFLSNQWFLKMDHLAPKGLDVILKNEIQLIPENWVKTFKHWMEDIEDWCISRQLWWGHQIPAWYCSNCQKISVNEKDITKCEHCSSTNIQQDEDVLDTWFSSALWPMSVLKWPEEKLNNHSFYPSSVLVTAPDILFFWVARMIMMGLEFQNRIPFQKVYLHGVVRDSQGRKMSKSLGNGEDPLDLIDEYGADALRLSLLSSHAKGKDVRFSKQNIETCRHFLNKIWNAGRFINQIIGNESVPQYINKNNFSATDIWILSKLKKVELKINKDLEEFRFSSACSHAYNFAWMEFCDWYLEWIKPIVYGSDNNKKKQIYWVLSHVFNRLIRLLHPFIPFITEEIYQKIKIKEYESIMLDSFPDGKESWVDYGSEQTELELDFIKDVISTLRQIRGENNIKPSQKICANIIISSHLQLSKKSLLKINQWKSVNTVSNIDLIKNIILTHKKSIIFLSSLESLSLVQKHDEKSFVASMPIESFPEITVLIHLDGIVDKEIEKQRLLKKISKLNLEKEKLNKQLNNKSFTSNAPSNIVLQKENKIKEIEIILKKLLQSLKRL